MKHFIIMINAREVLNLFESSSKVLYAYGNRGSVRDMIIQSCNKINEKAARRVTAFSGVCVKSEKNHYLREMKIGCREHTGISGDC